MFNRTQGDPFVKELSYLVCVCEEDRCAPLPVVANLRIYATPFSD